MKMERNMAWKHCIKRRIKRPFYFLAIIVLWVFAACTQTQTLGSEGRSPVHHLVVLHTNDTHGHPVRFSYGSMPNVGGLPARATLVRQIREKNENVLVLDAGDINTGRAESNLFKARPDIEGYNYIGYDAMVLGNHEFDNPMEILKKQMKWAHFPFLSANVTTRTGEPVARGAILKEVNGLKVAIFGLTTKSTEVIGNPEYVKDLVFEDECEVAKEMVPQLRKQADVVIALVHMGIYPSTSKGSKRLASEVSGIDLIVDGHTHTRLDAPVAVRNQTSGHRTWIVQAWKWGLVLGRVDLWIQDKRVIDLKFQTLPINLKEARQRADGTVSYHPLGKEIAEDQALLKRLQPYVDRVMPALAEVIGQARQTFSNSAVRNGETALGDLVADSMEWYTKTLGVDFAIQNGGGIRAELPKGPITKGTLYEILPFDNSLVVLTLRGSSVRSLFEHIANLPADTGAFPQVSRGLRFTISRRGKTCEDILIHARPLDPNGTYKVVTNSYLARGGDGYHMFLDAIETYDCKVSQQDVFAQYIKLLGGAIEPKIRGRITISSFRARPLKKAA
jgi:5'-nucleotidase/UDP-sugar diphosphatase